MFLLNVVIVVLLFVLVVMIISVFVGVPFLPTHLKQARIMMDLAELKEGMRAIDLGSGSGRLLFLAASRGAHATGYELNPFLFWWTKFLVLVKGQSSQIDVFCQSIYKADLGQADVVFTFLMNKPMKHLEEKLFNELKPGSKIISYTFPILGRVPIKKEQGIFVYRV